MVMVPREHEENCYYSWWHHHDALGGDGVRVYLSVVICSDARLLFLCVAVERA